MTISPPVLKLANTLSQQSGYKQTVVLQPGDVKFVIVRWLVVSTHLKNIEKYC